ncbi:MAG: hypothetical protein VB049_07670 [Candidatus Pelethousia sp.]|nr:hypothetical protein [Candidatus Pelethousia sp.]
MKNLKKIAAAGAIVLTLSVTSMTALAASGYNTPAEIVAKLAGKSVESVTTQRVETGKTYGSIADGYGVLDAFRSQMLEQKKAYLAQQVAAGTMTEEKADTILAAMKTRQADCDGSGSGSGRLGAGMGAGFGNRTGKQNGGGRNGSGSGLGSGACLVTE